MEVEKPFTRERLGTAQIFVIVDNDELCECKSQAEQWAFTSSLLTLLAVFYPFDLQYWDNEKNMCKFLKEHVICVVPKRKSYILKQIEKLFKINLFKVKWKVFEVEDHIMIYPIFRVTSLLCYLLESKTDCYKLWVLLKVYMTHFFCSFWPFDMRKKLFQA